jgi:hypothetical protein
LRFSSLSPSHFSKIKSLFAIAEISVKDEPSSPSAVPL